MEKLLIGILGTRNAGKSSTWYELFGKKVRTGKRERILYLNDKEFVDTFLISGSPEERHKDIEDIIQSRSKEHVKVFVVSGSPEERKINIDKLMPDELPNIVLCSIQDTEHGKDTIKYFSDHDYFIYILWLNPVFKEKILRPDTHNISRLVKDLNGKFNVVDGNSDVKERANSIRMFIRNWAKGKGLIKFIAT